MQGLLDRWHFYTLGEEDYKKCIQKIFFDNIHSLRQANMAVAILACLFTLFPLVVERNYIKAGIHFSCAVIAFFLCLFMSRKYRQFKQGKAVSNRLIYTQIILYYANVILFGIYLGVWSNPGKLAVSFMGILMCALFLFNMPPLANLGLTLAAMALFMTATILVKPTRDWSLDVVNAMFAGSIGLFFGWQITKFRMSLASTASKYEAERNDYYDQSTVDELTQLKNRRDFTQTFQRFLSSYRQSDIFLCISILDIDFFKNYNDYYGHPKGDECLRAIGRVLNNLRETKSVYSARIGGEEFAMIWFEREISHASEIALWVNQAVRDLKIPHEKSQAAPYVTVSIGVFVAQCGVYNDTRILYDRADKAMYTAKSGGRDRAVITY
jgi:diguanylate cyclase (GGDEF)-like protein